MNRTKGLLRLWLVGSLLWAVSVGWLTWPGNSPQQYARYWYYRVAHSEILKERRDTRSAALARLMASDQAESARLALKSNFLAGIIKRADWRRAT